MTIYHRNGRVITEDEAIDEFGCVRDGVSVSTPLMLRDGITRDDDIAALARAGVRFHDGQGNPAGHRPGYVVPTDLALIRARQRVMDAYREAEAADANAWRNPQPWAAALPANVPGHLTADALALLDVKEAAYREAAWADENAWRNAKP